MDFDEYVTARYGRLIEHAVLLGCDEGQAGTRVDQVLHEQRKAIGRAEDPDPLVREALEHAIAGPPERGRRAWVFGAAGLVAAVVAVGAAVSYQPPPEPMPSLFALSGNQAEQLLEDQGYDVVLRPARACEPQGLVLGSEPAVGRLVRDGATVTVRTAVPSGSSCDAQYGARSDAWRFVAFALGGGPAPEFARTVTVVVDSQDPYPLDHVAAVDPDRWEGLFKRVARTAQAPAPTTSGMPLLTVRTNLLPTVLCGVPKPDGTGDRTVLRLEIDARPDRDGDGCPLTIDLYRTDEHAIDGVVLYTAKDGTQETPAAVGLRPARVRD